MNYTINEIPNTATEANDADFAVLYQGNKTKKITFQNLFNKARRNNIFITATNTTISGPKLQAGDVIRVFFIAQQEGTDTTTAMALSYNDTSYNVKAPCNGSLKDFTANAITVETRELSKGAETEEEGKGETKSTRATSTAYVYCQAYTTLELLFDGSQFVIIGNPVVISSADYTIYTDGSLVYKDFAFNRLSLTPNVFSGGSVNYSKSGNYVNLFFNRLITKNQVAVGGYVTVGTLPEGYRPSGNLGTAGVICGTSSGNRQKYSVTISNLGEILLFNDYGNLANTLFYGMGMITFPIDF